MKITGLRLRELIGTLEHHDDFWEDRLIRPIDVYPEHQAESAHTGFWHPIKLEMGGIACSSCSSKSRRTRV